MMMAPDDIHSLVKEYGERLRDPWWRLTSGALYTIMTKDMEGDAAVVPFIPNQIQRQLLIGLHTRNVTLKSRQVGSTTVYILYCLDHALFNADQRCGIVGHDENACRVIFRDKVRFAYERLPEPLRERMPLRRESADELLFAHNNSSIRVATSMRSGTLHRLLVTEYAKLSAKFPDRAEEVERGSFPTVPPTGVIVVESTAEGRAGKYADLVRRAERSMGIAAGQNRKLHALEWRRNFVGWWMNPSDEAEPEGIQISATEHAYFDGVEAEMGVKPGTITLRKRAWYIATRDNQFSGDAEAMWQEYPSTPKESFSKSQAGKFFIKQVNLARSQGRILPNLPIIRHVPCNTFWDIAHTDGTAVWVHQYVHPNHRFVAFLEGWEEPYDTFIRQLAAMPVTWGTHYLPHDALQRRQDAYRVWTPHSVLTEMQPTWKFAVVPRVEEKQHAISAVRQVFGECLFDGTACKEGIEHLESYSKTWRPQIADWSDTPLHDEHSEAADSFMQFAQTYHALRSSGQQTVPKRHGARRRLS